MTPSKATHKVAMHTTSSGTRRMRVQDMTNEHLLNMMRWINRAADEGITVITGGMDADGVWGDIDDIEGDIVLDHFEYAKYAKECRRRRLACPK